MKTKRLINVDFLKGFALIVMIEVHIFNEMVLPHIKASSLFLNFINGLVAPTFIFSSGFAFFLSSKNKLNNLFFFSDEFIKQLKRIFFLIVAGYSLHLPYFSLQKIIFELDEKKLISLFNFDVLQCIGLGLLVLLILRTSLKNTSIYIKTITTLFLVFIIFTPIIWQIDFRSYFHISLATIFNNKYKSLFPIFPWFAFLFAGNIMGYLYDKYKDQNIDKLIKYSFILGTILIFISHTLWFYNPIFFDTGFKANPLFTLLRISYLLVLFSLSYIICNKIDLSKSFIIIVSKETLLVYWLHLQIMYRKFLNGNSLVDLYKGSLNLSGVFLGSFLLILIMIVIAYFWNKLKIDFYDIYRFIFYLFITSLIVLLVLL
ncbi:MAG TPA: heparan-alpha-glucosaminide N-acetyltransferase domain-containing protein [Ignavibacteriales bacterium]|nr:heparan-alpha-glucosaminide N-acetyltransferase domain-containing protein [Ignavibacteriales bacterium]